MAKKNVPVVSRAEPSAGFGAPVLLEGEDEALYEKLLTQGTAAVAPTDVIEEFWVRDVVDLLWEAMRLRRLKASLLRSSAMQGLEEILAPLLRSRSPRLSPSSTIARSRSDTSTSPSREREFGNLKGGGTRQLSAQNAKKHGLSLSVWHNAELAPDVEALSRRIAAGNEALLPLARDIAEAQIDLSRVRHLRGELIDRALRDPKFRTVEQSVQLLKLLARVVQIEDGRGRPSALLKSCGRKDTSTKKPKGGPSVTPRFCRGSRRSLREWTDTNGVREIDVTLEKKAP